MCVAERDFAGEGQRRKRRSVHVCYVNLCMFVHFESIQECVVFVSTTAHVSGLMHMYKCMHT